MLIGVIGDLHFKDKLSYNELFDDERNGEKKNVLDCIVDSFSDCDQIVFMGDNLNGRNNTSKTIRDFVEFVERFDGKKVHILCGNHEKFASGRSAIDFMIETKKKDWNVVINKVVECSGLIFCPYFTYPELGTNDKNEATKRVMDMIPKGNILFIHHALSGTKTVSKQSTDVFSEIVIDVKSIFPSKVNAIFGGHIHEPQQNGNVVVTGSVFTSEVHEVKKSVWKINSETLEITEIPLPVRSIYRLENPTTESLTKILDNSIVKIVTTDESKKDEINNVRREMDKRGIKNVLIENYHRPRNKVKKESSVDILEMSINDLLAMYSEQSKIDKKKLLHGMALIQEQSR